MAELEQSITDPVLLSNIIHRIPDRMSIDEVSITLDDQLDQDNQNNQANQSNQNIISDSDSKPDYNSDSDTELTNITHKVDAYRSMSEIMEYINADILLLNQAVAEFRRDISNSKLEFNKKLDQLLKQLIDTRTMLVQMCSSNKQDLKTQIKNIVVEEIKQQFTNRFDEIVKEQRIMLSQHIRKTSTNNITDMEFLKKQVMEMRETIQKMKNQ